MTEAMPDDMWTPYKHLQKVVETNLTTGQAADPSALEMILRKHKPNFINLLKNSPKNAKSREEIRKGITDGISLPSLGHTTLSKDLVDETIIISDMYDLNEYISLELLCTAHQQMPNHPGLNRGLVAVLLYYDGRKTLTTTLKDLFQAREGISWRLESSSEITNLVSSYTESLVADDILLRIIEQLERLDITAELALLSENRALGKPKHHRQVLDLFEEIRLQLATTLFCWSAQCGLPMDVIVRLIEYLAEYKPSDARGGIDDVTLAMLMALLYALDLSVFQKHEDSEDAVKRLPLIGVKDYAQTVLDAMHGAWYCDELRAVALYAFGLAMAALRQAPQFMQQNSLRIIDQNEALVESAIQGKVLDFIYHVLLQNETVYKTEFYYRRIHILLTDFIELMHSKVTELRARADEAARTIQCHAQQGLEPPTNLCQNFETLLLIVGKFYSNDRLGLQLDLEYWRPMDGQSGNYQTISMRSVSLFKFIRLAGELLPPTLFVPYLKMLAGLSNCQASAQKAFDFLKQGHGVSGSTTLSWDHFFVSLSKYYANLRQEQHPVSDTVYRNRMLNRNINPLELAGLQAVLSVIRAVATHDEFARIALCDHPNWQPLVVLLGLVGCSVVIPLKTELLLTLAALAKSKETALQLWTNLESSQIINTIPTTNNFASRGIKTEIEQIECRNETYPLTQALLDFLYTLATTAVPKNLGAGPRHPGLDPYVTFVLDTTFLRFYDRNYKDPAEKWRVAAKCLRLLEYFIRSYEVNPADFPVNGQVKEENPPPGFHVMLQMNTNDKSELLRLILLIIDEACARLDTYTTFAGKAALEQCALHCLNIVERTLSLQDLFFDAHFAGNCSILMSGLNKLLLGVNPRSARPDHMLNIARFVTYNAWLPKQALQAVKVLALIVRQPNVSALLLGEFTRTESLCNEIRHGFVECLESEVSVGASDNDDVDDDDDDDADSRGDHDDDNVINRGSNNDDVELSIKEAIIGLLEECLPQSAPNLAHYLLGFDINKDIRATRLQQPGVMEFPSNCIKSLITILDGGLERRHTAAVSSLGDDRLIQSSYRLLYSLCYNNKTSDVVLRFLRSCNDFFCRHISALPFENARSGIVLNQMTGLLKCVAIELKTTAANNQVTQFGNMCKILLGVVQGGGGDATIYADLTGSHYYTGGHTFGELTGSMAALARPPSSSANQHQQNTAAGLLICKLLECLDFDIRTVDRPKFDFFDNALMQQLLQTCELQANANGPKLINIKRLDDVLRGELAIVQSTIASGQMAMILREKEAVLKYALAINVQRNLWSATVRFLQAWGHVTETLFSVAPAFAISHDTKQRLIIEILQSLLNKIVTIEIMPELANLASSTTLQLLVTLRQCYNQQQQQLHQPNGNASDTTFALVNQLSTHGMGAAPKNNALSLKYILKDIVDWMLSSGASSQKLKSNLYTSMLSLLQIVKGTAAKKLRFSLDIESHDVAYVSRLDRSMATVMVAAATTGEAAGDEGNNQTKMAVEVFTAVGDKIIDILCHDCTGGHDICKMLAFSCIDVLLDMDPMVNFIQFISRRGYLAHIVDSLMKTDAQLCRVLDVQPDNLKALYVYEPKMAMLGRVASSHIGAGLLIEHKVLGVLSQMRVFDMHPDFQINIYATNPMMAMMMASPSFVPPVEQRYQQILFPALNLCDIVLSTLGPENRLAITQVVYFLLSHGDMVEVVLRAGTPFLGVGLLQELSAITGLIARTANHDVSTLIEPNANQDMGAHLYRLQKLMLGLFPRFILSEATLKELAKSGSSNTNNSAAWQPPNKDGTEGDSDRMRFILQIAANLALYARNSIANHSVDHRTTSVLFSPNINDGVQRSESRTGTLEVSPSIGLVVSQLKNCVEYYNREKHAYDGQLLQRNSLPSLSLDSKNAVQFDQLTEKLLGKQNEMRLCIFLTEHCLYLLWAHLDFYMLRAVSVNALQFNQTITTPTDAGWKVTSEDVGSLKKALVQVLNETFCKQLEAITQNETGVDKEFVSALLRRIKRLIQFAPVK